jgi:hypothetical protein
MKGAGRGIAMRKAEKTYDAINIDEQNWPFAGHLVHSVSQSLNAGYNEGTPRTAKVTAPEG